MFGRMFQRNSPSVPASSSAGSSSSKAPSVPKSLAPSSTATAPPPTTSTTSTAAATTSSTTRRSTQGAPRSSRRFVHASSTTSPSLLRSVIFLVQNVVVVAVVVWLSLEILFPDPLSRTYLSFAVRSVRPPPPADVMSWTEWDGSTILNAERNFGPCRWLPYSVASLTDHPDLAARDSENQRISEVMLCGHPFPDIISDFVAEGQRWGDCNGVVTHWHSIHEAMTQIHGRDDFPLIHLEVGANIGTCALELLLRTPVTVYAFEPHPRNLFRLTSTFSRIFKEHPQLKSRLRVFPVALGATAGKAEIFAAHDNLGNSQLGNRIQDWPSQRFMRPEIIPVIPLDPLVQERIVPLSEKNVTIGTIKLDAQGYECAIVKGMQQTLQQTRMVQFECAKRFLVAANCSGTSLMQSFEKAGMRLGGDMTISTPKVLMEVLNQDQTTWAQNPQRIPARHEHNQDKDYVAIRPIEKY